jgi:hypothetical protein
VGRGEPGGGEIRFRFRRIGVPELVRRVIEVLHDARLIVVLRIAGLELTQHLAEAHEPGVLTARPVGRVEPGQILQRPRLVVLVLGGRLLAWLKPPELSRPANSFIRHLAALVEQVREGRRLGDRKSVV